MSSVEVCHKMSSLKVFIVKSIKEHVGELGRSASVVMGTGTALEYVICKWGVEKYIM